MPAGFQRRLNLQQENPGNTNSDFRFGFPGQDLRWHWGVHISPVTVQQQNGVRVAERRVLKN